MTSIEVLENPVQEYSWGSFTAIADILGHPSPSAHPQAELWMGAHPKAPSCLTRKGQHVPLTDIISRYPQEVLGRSSSRRFGATLPFLFKILAAEKPLSIQVHPNAAQAKTGYAKENKRRIPLDAPNRNYKDMNHKPECIYALTDFWVLNGFRNITEIISFMEKLSGGLLAQDISRLKKNRNSNGLKAFFKTLMTIVDESKKRLIDTVLLNAEKKSKTDTICNWVMKLYNEYGNDLGVLSPIMLNLLRLNPGEAMFLPSGQLHSYLKGVGIELMANSDNVIRGGLTQKHVDLTELFHVVRFEECAVKLLPPKHSGPSETEYPCPANEFILSKIQVNHELKYVSPMNRNIEILICIEGDAVIQSNGLKNVMIKKGTSVLVPAIVNKYTIKGKAILYKSTVPQ